MDTRILADNLVLVSMMDSGLCADSTDGKLLARKVPVSIGLALWSSITGVGLIRILVRHNGLWRDRLVRITRIDSRLAASNFWLGPMDWTVRSVSLSTLWLWHS